MYIHFLVPYSTHDRYALARTSSRVRVMAAKTPKTLPWPSFSPRDRAFWSGRKKRPTRKFEDQLTASARLPAEPEACAMGESDHDERTRTHIARHDLADEDERDRTGAHGEGGDVCEDEERGEDAGGAVDGEGEDDAGDADTEEGREEKWSASNALPEVNGRAQR
jgi:hypothetical protein